MNFNHSWCSVWPYRNNVYFPRILEFFLCLVKLVSDFYQFQVAQKRKTILDQTSLERQQDMERNRLKLEDLKQSYEKEMLDILNKNKVSIIWKEFFIPISLFLKS